jgi:hypothetical protein
LPCRRSWVRIPSAACVERFRQFATDRDRSRQRRSIPHQIAANAPSAGPTPIQPTDRFVGPAGSRLVAGPVVGRGRLVAALLLPDIARACRASADTPAGRPSRHSRCRRADVVRRSYSWRTGTPCADSIMRRRLPLFAGTAHPGERRDLRRESADELWNRWLHRPQPRILPASAGAGRKETEVFGDGLEAVPVVSRPGERVCIRRPTCYGIAPKSPT